MRPLYWLGGLAILGIGVAGWAARGTAQPAPKDLPPTAPPEFTTPLPGLRPIPKPRPADELFERPASNPRTLPSNVGPIPVLDQVDIPTVPGVKPPAGPGAGVKPTVFIPGSEPLESPKTPASAVTQAHAQIAFSEPAVRLEWQGPTSLQVGAAAEYTLVARNLSSMPLHKVTVQVKPPTGAAISATEPKADSVSGVLLWDLGTLAARQDKIMKIALVPPEKGELQCQAWVTFTGSAAFKVDVREAKLAVVTRPAQKSAVDEPVTLMFTVSNSGDHPADGVKLALVMPEGIEAKIGPGSKIDLGKIAPGETREVKVAAIARARGTHKIDAVAEGLGGLKAVAATTLTAVRAKVDVELSGPKLRYLERKAVYSINVVNSGDAPATGVVIAQPVPEGFKFLAADNDGKLNGQTRTVYWSVGELEAGQSRAFKCELLATAIGDFTHKATAMGDRGLKAESSVATKVEGLSALAMEVTDSDDPLEVGADTTYEVRIANTGSKDETDVKLVLTIPPQMKFKSARGPGKHEMRGNEVVFETLAKLPARTEATYRITVTAKEKGDARFKATLTAGGLSEPVIGQESTRIYAD